MCLYEYYFFILCISVPKTNHAWYVYFFPLSIWTKYLNTENCSRSWWMQNSSRHKKWWRKQRSDTNAKRNMYLSSESVCLSGLPRAQGGPEEAGVENGHRALGWWKKSLSPLETKLVNPVGGTVPKLLSIWNSHAFIQQIFPQCQSRAKLYPGWCGIVVSKMEKIMTHHGN